jgi:spermidine synthase
MEFFEEVKETIEDDGLFALGLPSAENYWSPELARRNASVFHTLSSVYPYVLVTPGEHNFFLASRVPLEADAFKLSEELKQRGIDTDWVSPEYLEYLFTTDRFSQVRQEIEGLKGVRLNRDMEPICYYYDLSLWLSLFYPHLRSPFEGATYLSLWWMALPLLGLVLLVRRRRQWFIPAVLAGMGFMGMTLQLILLFTFQVLHGYLYAQVNLLIAAFMAGLALGAWSGNTQLSRNQVNVVKLAIKGLLSVEVGALMLSLLLWLLIRERLWIPAVVFPLLGVLIGALAGMAYPLAVASYRQGHATGAGLLYGADLVGACLGALLGAIFLIPILGIPMTCVVVAVISLAGILSLVGSG